MKLRVEAIEALDKVAENVQRGLRLILDGAALARNPKSLAELKGPLTKGRGGVCLELRLPDRSCAAVIALPGHYDVSPRQAGALSTVSGVLEVVET